MICQARRAASRGRAGGAASMDLTDALDFTFLHIVTGFDG
jgi:hypothetical protein